MLTAPDSEPTKEPRTRATTSNREFTPRGYRLRCSPRDPAAVGETGQAVVPDAAVYEALHTMRETRSHLAIVTHSEQLIGVVTLTDVLARLRPAAGVGHGSGTLAG